MAVQTASLVVTLVDRVTAPARAVNNAIGKLNMARRANTEQLMNVQMQMMGVAGAALVVGAAIKSPIQAAVEFESAMSDVRKVVDFDTPEQFEQLGVDIIALSKELPIAATGIADIVAAAGQAGMAGDELLAFAEMAAKVGVAFDISAAESGTALAKIKTALSLSVEDTAALADAINYLTNSMASDAPSIIQYMRRVAAQGEQYGFAAEQTAAIGSAMIAAGAEANVAATSFRNVGKALTRGTAATTSQRAAFTLLGLEATDVARRMQEDAAGTLEDVLKRIRALPRETQASALSQLFGDEARALAPLVENIGLYQQALESVSDQKNYLGSAEKEYSVRADTAANKLQILKNQANAMAIAVGDALVPSLVSLAKALGPILSGIEVFTRVNPQVVKGLVAIVGGLVGLRVASIIGRFAFYFLKDAVLSAALGTLKAAALLTRGTGLMVAGFKSLRAAALGATMLSSLGGAGLVGMLGGVATAITAIGAPIWAVAAAIIAAGLAVYKYWQPISNFFIGFGEVVGAALGQVANAVSSFVFEKVVNIAGLFGFDKADVSAVIEAGKAWVQQVWDGVVGFFKGLPGLFSMVQYSDEEQAGQQDLGRRVAQSFVDGFKAVLGGLYDVFFATGAKSISFAVDMALQIPGMLQWIYDAVLNGVEFALGIAWPEPPDWLKWLMGAGANVVGGLFGGGEPANSNVYGPQRPDGTRALGGDVAAGLTYLVGEQGPELFMPPVSGYVHTARQTAQVLSNIYRPRLPVAPTLAMAGNDNAANQNAVSQTIQFNGDIIIQNPVNATPQELAQAIGDEVSLRLRGEYSDGGF